MVGCEEPARDSPDAAVNRRIAMPPFTVIARLGPRIESLDHELLTVPRVSPMSDGPRSILFDRR